MTDFERQTDPKVGPFSGPKTGMQDARNVRRLGPHLGLKMGPLLPVRDSYIAGPHKKQPL